jgi:NADH-quinone oxidoreductase subunit E
MSAVLRPSDRISDAAVQPPQPNANRTGSMRHLLPEFERMKARYPHGAGEDFSSSLTLPCLHRIQDVRGYVADEDIELVVEFLGVPRIQVEEVLSYYGMFRRAPVGRWHVQVCRNVSCSMCGGEKLLAHLQQRLGVACGQTTADGRFTLSTVECLGSCGTAPVVMVNEAYHEALTPAQLDALLDRLE